MNVDKNKAIIEFLITCPKIYNSPLYFNFINASDSTTQIITVANDYYTSKPYVDGSVSKLFTFSIINFKSTSNMPIIKLSGYDNENIDDLQDVQSLIDWIIEQDELRNYPDFGEDCVIERMRPTSETPNLDGINTDVTPPLAMYSVTIQIDYIDFSKKVWREN